MTDKQKNPDPIAHAARLLREAAEELRQAHAYNNSEGWENETDAKAAYDEHMAAAQALEDWEAAVGAGGVQPLRSVLEGCKLVPLEPTQEMLAALMSPGEAEVLASSPSETFALMLMDRAGIRERYSAMLAASPTPPAEQTPRWVERWHGSGGKEFWEGWSILNAANREMIAHLGPDVDPGVVRGIVTAHNDALCGECAGTGGRWCPACAGTSATAEQQATSDPLDWPLPCDITAGSVTIGKGCPLRTVQTRLEVQAEANALLMRHLSREQAAPKAAPGEPSAFPMTGDEEESDLGQWQPGTAKPNMDGTYLREFDEGEATSEFHQGVWLRDGFFPSDLQDVRWRGRTAPQQEAQEPTTVDKKTMELAESVGLIGPASRVGDLHAAIQRFHDLICVNATIKAAVMAADVIRGVATPARDYPPLPMQFACSGLFPVYSADQMRAYVDADRAAYAPASSQPAPAPLSEREDIAMIDAAIVEMANIVPPLKRSECARLIRAALAAQGGE